MSDLDDVLKRHEQLLSASLSDAHEFDKVSARSAVRRRRTTRAALTTAASVVALGAIGTGGWLAYGALQDHPLPASVAPRPTHSPKASTTLSPTPSPAPRGRNVAEGPCPSRTTTMTSAEAATVASEPLTGESWLPAPVPIDAPVGDDSSWNKIGTVGDRTILESHDPIVGVFLFMLDVDGALTWIERPTPTAPLPESAATDWIATIAPGSDIDTKICFESLATPTTLTLDDGRTTAMSNILDSVSTFHLSNEKSVRELARYGAMPLIEISSPAGSLIADPTLADVTWEYDYGVVMPWGELAYLRLSFFDDAVAALGLPTGNFLDAACCGWPFAPEVRGTGSRDSDWIVVGSVHGHDVAVPTDSNPYVLERFAGYTSAQEELSMPAVTFSEFMNSPPIAGVRADEGGWWLSIGQYTPRTWG